MRFLTSSMEPVEQINSKRKTVSVTSNPHSLGYQQHSNFESNPNLSGSFNRSETPYSTYKGMYDDLNNESPKSREPKLLQREWSQKPLRPYPFVENQLFNRGTSASASPQHRQNSDKTLRKHAREQRQLQNLPNQKAHILQILKGFVKQYNQESIYIVLNIISFKAG